MSERRIESSVPVSIVRLDPGLPLPSYAHPGDAGADLLAAEDVELGPGERRLVPTGLMNELKPFALAIDAQRFRHTDLARDLKVTGLRAGLVASGSLLAGLRILSAQVDAALPAYLADPVAQGLVAFALGEDHAVVAR